MLMSTFSTLQDATLDDIVYQLDTQAEFVRVVIIDTASLRTCEPQYPKERASAVTPEAPLVRTTWQGGTEGVGQAGPGAHSSTKGYWTGQ
jgi:hypothetical protein